MNVFKSAALAALLLAPVTTAAHHDEAFYRLGPVTVSHVWTEETGRMSHGLDVFLTVENTGEAPVRLIAAETGFTDAGVFQSPVVGEDGALSVRDLSAIEVAPGQTITFQPGGLSVSLQNTQRGYDAGDHFHMTLEFETLGALEVEVEVERHEDGAPEDPAS
jgi:copper(I)-binding protein